MFGKDEEYERNTVHISVSSAAKIASYKEYRLCKMPENGKYRPLESIKDNYPRYVVTTDYLLQQRSGIRNVNLIDFICKNEKF